jgi:pyrimidine-nucleoside phosphorylase
MGAWFKDIIARKRDGGAVSGDEWRRFVTAVVAGDLPDYQIAAFLMAVYFRGLDEVETASLTSAMAASGERLRLGPGPYVDKHSTGGVGDSVTLVAAPWAAACGARIAKLSGRGLGHTGGTIDKLASVPGLDLALSADRLRELADRVGWAVAEASNIAPADKILYALRDATATVEATPLIVASILSKKLAGGAPAFVFDVKAGSGAFVPDEAGARDLAERLVAAARASKRRAVAIITAMEEPVGRAVGNALEVREAADALRGRGPEDLVEISRRVAAEMLVLAGVASAEEAPGKLDRALGEGRAFGKLNEMARAQGAPVDWLERLPEATYTQVVCAEEAGYISRLDARAVARAANALGAGRARAEDVIDPAAGVLIHKKKGEEVSPGDAVLTLCANDAELLPEAEGYAREGVEVGEKPAPRPLILDVIR